MRPAENRTKRMWFAAVHQPAAHPGLGATPSSQDRTRSSARCGWSPRDCRRARRAREEPPGRGAVPRGVGRRHAGFREPDQSRRADRPSRLSAMMAPLNRPDGNTPSGTSPKSASTPVPSRPYRGERSLRAASRPGELLTMAWYSPVPPDSCRGPGGTANGPTPPPDWDSASPTAPVGITLHEPPAPSGVALAIQRLIPDGWAGGPSRANAKVLHCPARVAQLGA